MSRSYASRPLLILAALTLGALARPAFAANDEKFDRYCDSAMLNLDKILPDDPDYLKRYRERMNITAHSNNLGATSELGEPSHSDQLSHSIHYAWFANEVNSGCRWRKPSAPRSFGFLSRRAPVVDSRVVIHTFNSERSGNYLNTALGIYTGSAVDALTEIAFNDDTLVPGISTTQSLVQFDVLAGTDYSIQVGSGGPTPRQQGNIDVNVFRFKPGGGLMAFLATLNGFMAPPGDYICGYNASLTDACYLSKFILHNSTSQTMTVTASQTLGGGVVVPPPITLAPGALGTMEFDIGSSFDQTTVRTVFGYFQFTGRTNGTIVDLARHPALIVVKSPTEPPDVLRVAVAPTVQAGLVNEALKFQVRLTNTGTETLTGCHVRSSAAFGGVQTVWQTYDPGGPVGSTRPASAGPLNELITIQPGQTVLTLVYSASDTSRIANPLFVGSNQPFVADCANSALAPIDFANVFDFTARGGYDPARVNTSRLAPAGGVLDVPAGGAGFRVSAVNTSETAATLIATPTYMRPFEETAANQQFSVKICRTDAAGACTTAEATSVQFNAAPNVVNRFKVIVRPPTGNPGYDPGKRRVFLVFDQDQPVGNIFSVPLASQSVAVRKN